MGFESPSHRSRASGSLGWCVIHVSDGVKTNALIGRRSRALRPFGHAADRTFALIQR